LWSNYNLVIISDDLSTKFRLIYKDKWEIRE